MDIQLHPFPHAIVENIFPDEVYRRACDEFPVLEARAGGRAGRDLFADDEGYAKVVGSIPWKTIHERLTGSVFVDKLLLGFRRALIEHGCKVSANDYQLSTFIEPRALLQSPVIDPDADPDTLFVRMDFQEAGPGYFRNVHCDHRRRVVSGIIFFCDAEAQVMDGGQFVLYGQSGEVTKPEVFVDPRHNRAVFFLCCNTSFHEAALLKSCRGSRRWLYYSVSSKVDVW